jgi:hypothetical protein
LQCQLSPAADMWGPAQSRQPLSGTKQVGVVFLEDASGTCRSLGAAMASAGERHHFVALVERADYPDEHCRAQRGATVLILPHPLHPHGHAHSPGQNRSVCRRIIARHAAVGSRGRTTDHAHLLRGQAEHFGHVAHHDRARHSSVSPRQGAASNRTRATWMSPFRR